MVSRFKGTPPLLWFRNPVSKSLKAVRHNGNSGTQSPMPIHWAADRDLEDSRWFGIHWKGADAGRRLAHQSILGKRTLASFPVYTTRSEAGVPQADKDRSKGVFAAIYGSTCRFEGAEVRVGGRIE